MNQNVIHNPIIRGYHPDPSMCRVGDDFYIVVSSFEFFPGVPIYHSKNLVEWERIGSCLTSDTQLPLQKCLPSKGIYAPTLRYHNGTFYMITTNVSSIGNFIVTTKDIRGKWSEPACIDHDGIDPSLFFDDDGKVYYCGTGDDENGQQGIVLFEIDVETGKILSDKKYISYGITGGAWPEAPHIYKINGYYYLMMAEGGTEYGHMETIFRSRNIWGPYEACPRNPILRNRYVISRQITCTGHADLFEDQHGNWWMVCLGIRKFPQTLMHNLGRETFLAPVVWDENGWPVVNGDGVIREEILADLPAKVSSKEKSATLFHDDFTSGSLKQDWTFLRNPDLTHFTSGNGYLQIDGDSQTLNDFQPNFIGVRQSEFCIEAKTTVNAELESESAKAGISVYYSNENHYDLYIEQKNGTRYVALSKRIMDLEAVVSRIPIQGDEPVALSICADEKEYRFYAELEHGKLYIGSGTTAGVSTEATISMTFTGVFIGLFAHDTTARFSSFSIDLLA